MKLLLSNILLAVDNKTIGRQLKKARTDSGLSQEEVAQKLGVTWEMVSRYENGHSNAVKHLPKLAAIFEKSLDFFLHSGKQSLETINVKKLAEALRDSGVTYGTTENKCLVKLIDFFSGQGLEHDIASSDEYFEVKPSLVNNYDNLFALRLGSGDLDKDIEFHEHEIGIFSIGTKAVKDDIVIGFDGRSYKVYQYQAQGQSTYYPIATLISTERKYKG